jgi:hypothetical protein
MVGQGGVKAHISVQLKTPVLSYSTAITHSYKYFINKKFLKWT